MRWKFLTAPLEKFQKKISKTMVVGAVYYARGAKLLCEPLFCHLMPFRGEGEMDREIAEANDLAAYFLEGEAEGDMHRWGWHCRSPGHNRSPF